MVKPAALTVGDYSLEGFENEASVERKSGADLIACLMGANRDRFKRELQRARALRAFMVVVEEDWAYFAQGKYPSKMKPHSACSSILSMVQEFRAPFHFAGSRASAEYSTWNFLRQFLNDETERRKAIGKHGG